MKIFIKPQEGIEITQFLHKKKIYLGATKDNIIQLIGVPILSEQVEYGEHFYYYNNSLCIEFDKTDSVISIQITKHFEGNIYIGSLPVFGIPVKDLIKEYIEYNVIIKENNTTFNIIDLGMSFWRESEKNNYFDTCLIATEGYL